MDKYLMPDLIKNNNTLDFEMYNEIEFIGKGYITGFTYIIIFKLFFNSFRYLKVLRKNREKLADYLNNPKFLQTRQILDAILQFCIAMISAVIIIYIINTVWMNGTWDTEEYTTKVIRKNWP